MQNPNFRICTVVNDHASQNKDYRGTEVIDKPSIVCALLGAALKAAETGVLDLVGTALRLCAI